MAYQTPWNLHKAEACKRQAEERVGLSPLGYLYRLEEAAYSTVVDADAEVYGSRTQVELIAFPIARRTPKGWRIWLDRAGDPCPTRFVLEAATKRYALPTIEQALESYVARKTKEARIYDARAGRARWLIEQAAGRGFTVGRMVG